MNNSSFKDLEEVIVCFYDSNNSRRVEAQERLEELIQTPDIWRIIFEDLLVSGRPEVQFYGATVLHSKLINDWEQIPLDQYDLLKTKILEAIFYFRNVSEVVHSRLCINLAIYMIRTITTHWPNAVEDLINILQPQNVQTVSEDILAAVLLEILSVIPEQFQTMIMSKNQRILARNSIAVNVEAVITLLEKALTSSNKDIMSRALKCTKSWLEFGLPIENCSTILDTLINIILVTYTNPDASGLSISCLEAISILCNNPSNTKYTKTLTEFIRKILVLANIYKSVENQKINADLLPCLCTLFVEIGESHVRLLLELINTPNHDLCFALIRIVLDCCDAPGSFPVDESYSNQTFNFFYHLQEDLLSDSNENQSNALDEIRPFYRMLVPILLKKSAYPKHINTWSLDDQDKFRCYRQDIADSYMYCYMMIQNDLVDMLLNGMKYAIYDLSTVDQRWTEIEAHLHAFHAISEHLISINNELTNRFIEMVQTLPLANMNPRVSLTAMELIGGYAEWFSDHPEYLDAVMNLILTAVSIKELSASASLALKDIARECHYVLHPHADKIVLLIEEILSKKALGNSEELRLIFTLGKMLSVLPVDFVLCHLELVVTPYVTIFQEYLKNPISKEIRHQTIVHCINVFQQFFLSLNMKVHRPPTYLLFERILPLYKELASLERERKFLTCICESIKYAISNLIDECSNLVPEIVDFLVTLFKRQYAAHAVLDLAKQIVLLFGNDAIHLALISNMLQALCSITISTLNEASADSGNLSNHTDLLESFYGFSVNLIKKNIKMLLSTPNIDLNSIFRYASLTLGLQEVSSVKASSVFFTNLIYVSRDEGNEMLLNLVQAHGAELVYQIICALGKVSPRSCLEPIADVLIALNRKYCDSLSRWLNDTLGPDNFPTPRATRDMKRRFIKAVLRERNNKRRIYEVTREFSFTCRGIINKEYIQETSQTRF